MNEATGDGMKVCLSSATSISFNAQNCQSLPSSYSSSLQTPTGKTSLHSFSLSDSMIRIEGKWNYDAFTLPLTSGLSLNSEKWIGYSSFRSSFVFAFKNVGYYLSVVDGRIFTISGLTKYKSPST
jgi:hypothetical protein